MLTLRPRRKKARYVVLAPFSRWYPIARFFESLAASDVPFADCEFVGYVDHDEREMADAVARLASELPFARVTVHFTGLPPVNIGKDTTAQRKRQAMMRAHTFDFIRDDADLLLLLEDDTTVPADTWRKLTAMLADGYDWASGFEVGRWAIPCAGIWRIEPKLREAMMPKDGVEDCDATGVYLVLTTPAVYKARPWDVYDNRWGQDVTVTHLLKQDGYRMGVDWSLECVHMGPDRDWLCSEVVPHRSKMPPMNPHHFSVPEPPPADRREYCLAVDVNYAGKTWVRGTKVSHDTARLMSLAGAIKAVIR